MKKLLTGLAMSLLALIAGCGGETHDSEFPRGITADTIKIGSHTDLSGVLAIWGVPMVNGMRQRFDELADAGGVHGRTIDFVVEDTQYQVPLAVRATNKLLNVEEIFAMLGSMGTPHNNAVFESMFEANVPSIFPLTAAVSMYEPLHPMKFSFFVSYRDQIRGGMRYLVQKYGYEKVCVQSLATDYGAEVGIGFEQSVEENGLEVVYEGRHKISEIDFTGTVTSIKNSGCEMLVLGPFIKDTIQLYTAARDAGWEGTVVANMVPYLPEIPAAADGGMEGLYAAAPFFVPDFSGVIESEWVSAWHTDYVERYSEEPAAQSVIGYVMADLLIQSLETAGPDLTVEKMLAALEGISRYDNPFGGPTISFSAQKHMGGDYLNLYQVIDRKWVTVAESLPF
jgi:branched-chain amino acid transport system substrate-binding protein